MAGRVSGKVALITGGGSGIGRAAAILFAREGAKVMIADYNREGGEQTVKMIKTAGGEASFVEANVAVAKQAEAMVAKTVETYGRLDCAFNNAGIEGQMGGEHRRLQRRKLGADHRHQPHRGVSLHEV